MRPRKAFTVIELITVCLILVLLILMAKPAFSRLRDQALRSKTQQTQQNDTQEPKREP